MSAFLSRQDLFRLSSGRWLIPILALLDRDGSTRFGVLTRQLGISRSVLSGHIDALERFGWLLRNPGHGHPLRPEYLLTAEGRPIAAWCDRAIARRAGLKLGSEIFRRWSLPLLNALNPAAQAFTPLQRTLTPITPRALSLALQQMQDARLVEQRQPLYRLSALGRDFARPLLPESLG